MKNVMIFLFTLLMFKVPTSFGSTFINRLTSEDFEMAEQDFHEEYIQSVLPSISGCCLPLVFNARNAWAWPEIRDFTPERLNELCTESAIKGELFGTSDCIGTLVAEAVLEKASGKYNVEIFEDALKETESKGLRNSLTRNQTLKKRKRRANVEDVVSCKVLNSTQNGVDECVKFLLIRGGYILKQEREEGNKIITRVVKKISRLRLSPSLSTNSSNL